MGKELHITKGTGKAIAKMLGVSEVTVSRAIRGKIDTKMARKIRALAINAFGAVEVTVEVNQK